MSNIHECEEYNNAVLDTDDVSLDMKISDDGEVEICCDGCDGSLSYITVHFKFCPFCGKPLAEEAEETVESTVRYDCKCINIYNGRCMNCGRRAY